MDSGSNNLLKVSLNEAKDIQKKLAQEIEICRLPSTIKRVAGFDISYLNEKNLMIAGMVIIDFPSLNFIDSHVITDHIFFPYIPGYLSFREAPALLKLIETHHHQADVFVFDGHGVAHPRGLGIASHIGVLAKKPSIGCAKKKLVGSYQEPGNHRGESTDLVYKDSIIGKVLRTKPNIKPVFISVGNMATLKEATAFMLSCTGKFRLPEPTRLAHMTVSKFKNEIQ